MDLNLVLMDQMKLTVVNFINFIVIVVVKIYQSCMQVILEVKLKKVADKSLYCLFICNLPQDLPIIIILCCLFTYMYWYDVLYFDIWSALQRMLVIQSSILPVTVANVC